MVVAGSAQGNKLLASRVPREETLPAFIEAYGTRGFVACADGTLEAGFEKIAIFAKQVGGATVPTHAALQLETGRWTSKMGNLEDISHSTFDAVGGPCTEQSCNF